MNNKKKKEIRWLGVILITFCLLFMTSLNVQAQKFKYGLGDTPLPQEQYQKHLKIWSTENLDVLPGAYDARDDNIVTSAKNQGSCGSCWAFASVGAFESKLLRFGFSAPDILDLGEQQQVSCNSDMAGCCGGNASAILFWADKGPINENCSIYNDGGTSCPIYSNVDCGALEICDQLNYRVINWHTVAASPDQFKASLYNEGPSYWRFTVYEDFPDYWNNGTLGNVYVQTYGKKLGGHAVLLIGYDDAKGAYLLKNSWGEIGGPNGDGTFWLAYSGHRRNLQVGMVNFNITECSDSQETPDLTCNDGLDNDCDGDIDCDDSDCEMDSLCQAAVCGNGVCESGEDCRTCPDDCAGLLVGPPSERFCCSGDDGGCSDTRCNSGGYICPQ